MPPQEATISSRDLAERLKQRYPQLGKYTDDSIVESFLEKNPKFRGRIKFEAAPVPATKITPRGPREKFREAVSAGKEALPAIGAASAVALTPETGGLSGLLQLLLAAGIGGGTGKAGEQAVGYMIGEKQPQLPERLEDIGLAGLEQAGAEGIGRSFERPVAKILGQGSRVVTHPEDIAVREISEKYGLHLTPAEIEKRGIQESVQRSAEGSILGRSTMQNVKDRTFNAAESAVNDALSRITQPGSALQAGESLQASLKDANEIFHSYGRKLYEDVDKYGGNVLVNLQPLKDFANQRLTGPAGQAAALYPKMAKFTTAERAILQDASASPDLVTFSVAHELRKRLLSVGPELTETMPGIGKGMAKKAAGIVTEAMEKAGSGIQGAQAVAAWQAARSFWRDGAEIFGDGLIQKLVEEQPSLVVRAIKTPEDVEMVRNALRNYSQQFGTGAQRQRATQAWDQFRERYVRENLLKSPAGPQIEREPLRNLADNLKKTPPETLNAMFSDPRGRQVETVLREIGQAMERVNQMPEAPTMSFWRMLHFGGLEEYEWVVAKALERPRLARRLLYGVRQLPRSFATFAHVMNQLQDETEKPEPGATTGRPVSQAPAELR